MNKNKIELLSPAGSYDAFLAALGAGADAVYVGGADFGARAYARNFTQEELIQAIETAHLHNKKLYLTVNTLLKNRELKEKLYSSLLPLYEAGLDAVIVQDLGVFRFIKENFPEMHIHASTQMTVTGPYGMKFLEEQGATRVVAARELSLQELTAMHNASPIEIEAFIHGALCYSYSGQCLMSSMLGGRSGNRGRCAQPCRLPYHVREEKGRYSKDKDMCPLSLKDICTIEILPEIIQAGVMSLKIEGRMKQPEYTAGVTSVYRKYLDLYQKDPSNYKVAEEDLRYLLNIFNRGGSCQGYFKQQNGPSMMAFSNEKKTGNISVPLKRLKEKIKGNLMLYPESPAILEVSLGNLKTTVSLGEVQYAREHPMSVERIRQQMDKLGNSEFCWESLEIYMDENIFIPVKILNELRRTALEQLQEQILGKYRRTVTKSHIEKSSEIAHTVVTNPDFYVSCETQEQALVLYDNPQIQGMYLPYDAMKYCIKHDLQHKKELFLALPYITRGSFPENFLKEVRSWISAGMRGFLIRNLESYGMLKEAGLSSYCVTDASLYTWNDQAIAFWREQGTLRNTIPLELNEKELLHRDNSQSEFIIYGYSPLMLSAQCVQKNRFHCNQAQSRLSLKDRYDKEFTCVCVCNPWKTETTVYPKYCYNILYNSIPYGLLKEASQVQRIGASVLRMNFTIETPGQVSEIIKEFQDVYLNGKHPSDHMFTKGHFKRGAE